MRTTPHPSTGTARRSLDPNSLLTGEQHESPPHTHLLYSFRTMIGNGNGNGDGRGRKGSRASLSVLSLVPCLPTHIAKRSEACRGKKKTNQTKPIAAVLRWRCGVRWITHIYLYVYISTLGKVSISLVLPPPDFPSRSNFPSSEDSSMTWPQLDPNIQSYRTFVSCLFFFKAFTSHRPLPPKTCTPTLVRPTTLSPPHLGGEGPPAASAGMQEETLPAGCRRTDLRMSGSVARRRSRASRGVVVYGGFRNPPLATTATSSAAGTPRPASRRLQRDRRWLNEGSGSGLGLHSGLRSHSKLGLGLLLALGLNSDSDSD